MDKLGSYDADAIGWSDDEIRGIAAPTLITVGDCDMVKLEHAVRFPQLRGGDVNGGFDGVPASQLAVFPATVRGPPQWRTYPLSYRPLAAGTPRMLSSRALRNLPSGSWDEARDRNAAKRG